MNSFLKNTTVIKIGTDVCTLENGRLNAEIIQRLIDQVMDIQGKIGRVLLVTSGAVAKGRELSGVTKTETESDARKRAFAARGQIELMGMYGDYLKKPPHEALAHQILLTKENFASEKRSGKLIETLDDIAMDLGKKGLVILNENDPIADEEIKFTDNDHLARLLAELARAQRVIFLTGEVHGVQKDKSDIHTVIPEIRRGQQQENRRYIVSGNSTNGKGGMDTKYDFACALANIGIIAHIANGKIDNVIPRILLRNESIGTKFSAEN